MIAPIKEPAPQALGLGFGFAIRSVCQWMDGREVEGRNGGGARCDS